MENTIILSKEELKKEKRRQYNKTWRTKHPEEHKEVSKKYYHENIKNNEEYKKIMKARSQLNRDKKKQQLIDQGIEIKKRGRPRTVLIQKTEV